MTGAIPSKRVRRSARRLAAAFLLGAIATAVCPARADDFDRIIGAPLFDVPRRPGAKGTSQLSLQAIASLPEVLRGERSALIIATTDQGNVAKILVSPGLRRKASNGNLPSITPVLSLDRFETIDRADRIARKARGRGVILFDGFEFDLDTGQVVPKGFGGDIAFSSAAQGGPGLIAVGEARLYPIDRPLTMPGVEPGRPSPGPTVRPTDFDGRYTMISNGQMSGALEIAVAPDGAVAGRFRSDRNGNMYPVGGKVAADLPRRIVFEIQFPRSRQSFDGLLWTEEKNVFAGTVQILEHPYSFIAVREGAPLLPESIEANSPPRAPRALAATTRVISIEGPDRYALDGVPRSIEELEAALKGVARAQRGVDILIRVPPSIPFASIEHAVRAARGAGIETIRFAGSEAR